MKEKKEKKVKNIAHNIGRSGIVGIFIYNKDSVEKVNKILADFNLNIRGRMGIVLSDVCVISLIFYGTTDELGAFTGKLGKISGVEVRSFLTKIKKGDIK